MLQLVAQHGQVVHRAEGRWVLKLQRQAVVEEVLAGLVEGEAGVAEGQVGMRVEDDGEEQGCFTRETNVCQ